MEAAIITALGMAAIALIERIFDNRRSGQQIQRERERECHERHRRLRDEPLLTLRRELARMATKNARLLSITQMLHTAIPAPPKEELEEWLDHARRGFNDYLQSGEFGQVLFTIDDKEIVERVNELEKDFRMAFYRNTLFANLSIDEQKKTFTQSAELARQVREIQGLINQRLEQL